MEADLKLAQVKAKAEAEVYDAIDTAILTPRHLALWQCCACQAGNTSPRQCSACGNLAPLAWECPVCDLVVAGHVCECPKCTSCKPLDTVPQRPHLLSLEAQEAVDQLYPFREVLCFGEGYLDAQNRCCLAGTGQSMADYTMNACGCCKRDVNGADKGCRDPTKAGILAHNAVMEVTTSCLLKYGIRSSSKVAASHILYTLLFVFPCCTPFL